MSGADRRGAVRPGHLPSGQRAGTGLGRRDDAPAVQIGLEGPRRGHQLRVVGDRPRPASRCSTARRPRSGRACGRGTCRTRSAWPRPRPWAAGAWAGRRDRGPRRAARWAATRGEARGRGGPWRSGGWPRQRRRPPIVALRGRKVSVVSTRPVTGRVGFVRGGHAVRAARARRPSRRRPRGPAATPIRSCS